MSIIFLAKGTCTMGSTTRDKDGSIIESTPAQFTYDDKGGCVVIGKMDPETMKPAEPVDTVYGDWDAASYLAKALELLKPGRRVNIPNFKEMVQNLWKAERVDICDHCQDYHNCRDCIVNEWKEEAEDDS